MKETNKNVTGVNTSHNQPEDIFCLDDGVRGVKYLQIDNEGGIPRNPTQATINKSNKAAEANPSNKEPTDIADNKGQQYSSVSYECSCTIYVRRCNR